jgi:nickel superoxide dismutase
MFASDTLGNEQGPGVRVDAGVKIKKGDRMKNIVRIIAALCFLFNASLLYAHCEIPCGIYDDRMRIKMIEEHIATVERSMDMIDRLSKDEPLDYNQLVRWIDNKETHATMIQDIVFQYFMAQRIKPVDMEDKEGAEKYSMEMRTLHQLAVEAMRSKQSTDPAHIKNMRDLVTSFSSSYFEGKE